MRIISFIPANPSVITWQFYQCSLDLSGSSCSSFLSCIEMECINGYPLVLLNPNDHLECNHKPQFNPIHGASKAIRNASQRLVTSVSSSGRSISGVLTWSIATLPGRFMVLVELPSPRSGGHGTIACLPSSKFESYLLCCEDCTQRIMWQLRATPSQYTKFRSSGRELRATSWNMQCCLHCFLQQHRAKKNVNHGHL